MRQSPKRSDNKISFDSLQRSYDELYKLENLHFDPSVFQTFEDPTGVFVTMSPAGDVAVPEDWAIKLIDGTSVTIYGGTLIRGTSEVTCVETTLVITTSTAIIGWQYDYVSGLTLVNFGSSFALDPAYIRKKLYSFSKEGNAVTLTRKFHPEIFPAEFGNE
jgi:hypothetical protein